MRSPNGLKDLKLNTYKRGGNNTKYFHLIDNEKHRKKICQLEQKESTIVGEEHLKVCIAKIYKKFFGALVPNNFTMIKLEKLDTPKF
jgi:hypothetical protein